MKKFIIKSTLFLLFPLVLYVSAFTFLKLKLSRNILKSEAIILGDSHTEGIIIPNVYNYSIVATPYIVHYNFLKSVEDELNNKVVFISFGYHNLSSLYENRLNKTVVVAGWLEKVNRELSSTNFLKNTYNHSWEDNVLDNLFSKSRIDNLYKWSYKKRFNNERKVHSDSTLNELTLMRHYTNPDYTYDDKIQKKYLSLIIEFLQEKDCKIYLLNTPITEDYLKGVPRSIKKMNKSFVDKHPEVQYLDLNTILKDKMDSTLFKDPDHTNLKGDNIVNKYLENSIL